LQFFFAEKLSMAELTNKQKKDYAKSLYLGNLTITQKEIASRVGTSEKTLSGWINREAWDKLRVSLLTTRETQLSNLYAQLSAINTEIAGREEGKRYPTNKEADVISKITSSIQKLEMDLSIGDIVNVSKRMLDWLRAADLEKAKEMSGLFDAFIKDSIR